MRKRGFIWSIAALFLVVGGSVGCEGDKASVPDSADKRMKQTTQRLPSDAQMAFVFSDLEKFRSNASKTKATIDRLTSTKDLMGQQTQQGFAAEFMGDASFDQLLEKKFWKKRGIAPNSSFTLSAVDYNQVVQTYVDDKKAFEKALTGDGDAKTKSTKIADQDVKKLEQEGDPVLWSYDGKLVTVVYPSDEMTPDDVERGKPKETMKKILETKKEESLHASSGFQKYREAAGDRPTLAYLNLEPILKEQDLEGRSESYKQYAKAIRESVDGGGVIVETSDQKRIETRLWIGLTEKGKKRFDKTFQTSVQADFSKYATENTLAALRLEIDWSSFWNSVESTMPKQQQKMLKSQFKKGKEATGLDIRKDVIGNLNGQVGVFVYGVGGKASPELLGNPTKALGKLEALYVMKFGDAETLSKIAKNVDGLSEDYLNLRPLEVGKEDDKKKIKSVKVLEMKTPPGGIQQAVTGMPAGDSEEGEPKPAPVQAYIHEDTLMLAARAIPESEIRTMFTGKGDGAKSLTESEKLDLGKKFATTERMSGLYVNFDRLRFIFGDILGSKMIPAKITDPIDTLEEGLLSTAPKKQGLFVDLTVDLVPKGASTKGESADKEGSGEESGGEESAQDEK